MNAVGLIQHNRLRRALGTMRRGASPKPVTAPLVVDPTASAPQDLRAAALLSGVRIDHEVGLEVGPLDHPLVARRPGRQIFYADYTTADVLRRRSANDPNVNCDAIPEIDYVVAPLPERLDRSFDYIIASHVIEHVPDMLGWVTTLLGWLAPGGRLILAIPDRRYCFDYLRPVSTSGQVMEAFFERRQKPPFSVIYDGMRQAVRFDVARAWREEPYRGPFETVFNMETAFRVADQARRSGEYQDCHCWVFTHASFIQIIGEINAHNVAAIRIVSETAPIAHSCEFHVVLAPGP